MVTIKEVAKLAGVSHGTVSNVINGATNVSVDKIQKVKAAMKELGYKPNVTARNMKVEHTGEINLIVPNIRNREFIELYESLNRYAKQQGYFVNLKVTDEVPTEERRLLNEALMRNVDGVILVTCQPENEEFFDTVIKNGLHIIFALHEAAGGKYHFVGLDLKKAVKERIQQLVAKGYRKIALITGAREYSLEEEISSSYFMALCESGIVVEPDFVENCNFGEGSAFRAAVRMMNGSDMPQAIFVSNAEMEDGVRRAIDIAFSPWEKKPELIVIKPYDWENDSAKETIALPFYKVAKKAFGILLDIMEKKETAIQREIVKVEPKRKKIFEGNRETKGQSLRILLNESPSSRAVSLLLPDFKKKTGIDVEIETKPYTELFDEIWRHKKDSSYDIYSIDFPWLKDLVASGGLEELDELYQGEDYYDYFTQDVLDKSARVDGRLYAVPYSFTVQLLFYRKDLFNKLENQRLYYEWYKEDLKVPATWEEFNKIAKLFTKKYNAISDTEYGVTLGGRKYSGAVNEYLPRMYAFDGRVFKNGEVSIAAKESVKALENYLESYNYANPKAVDWWWDDQVEEYCRGNAAMMVMYTEHVSALEDRRFSKVVGKTQAAILPGKYSVLGGWSLGINKRSEKMEAAYEFVKWMSSYELFGPNAALGRMIPSDLEDYRAMGARVYSWAETAWEAYAYTMAREVPMINGKTPMTEAELEVVLGEAVGDVVKGRLTVVQAMNTAKKRLEGIIKA